MKKGKNAISNWNLKGGGMSKHRKSGVAHNHANSIARVREYNQEQAKLVELKKKQKGQLFSSVKEVFQDKTH